MPHNRWPSPETSKDIAQVAIEASRTGRRVETPRRDGAHLRWELLP
jgi:hypothetical protein